MHSNVAGIRREYSRTTMVAGDRPPERYYRSINLIYWMAAAMIGLAGWGLLFKLA